MYKPARPRAERVGEPKKAAFRPTERAGAYKISIKNKRALFAGVPEDSKKRRLIICEIIEYVLRATSPSGLLQKPLRKLSLNGYKRIAIIAIGKAARTMGKACIELLPRKADWVLYADEGHPLPTEKGVKNTKRIMKIAQQLTKDDLAIVLLSGGGSAMFVQPVKGISLKEKIATTKALLMSGATINEINAVRKHLSQVKGGRLAQLLSPAHVAAFVMSDVVENDLSTIASGPLSADKTTFKDVEKIIQKYDAKIPKRVREFIKSNEGKNTHESVKPSAPFLKNVSIAIIADHYTALKAAKEKAKKYAYEVAAQKEMLAGEACNIAKKFVQTHSQKNTIYLACGETTVTCCKKPGCGGRNQEFVLSALRYLKPYQTIASFGTDGIDGICPEKVAGAIADGEVLRRAHIYHLNITDYLRRNDSYSFFRATNALLYTGPTGTNLGDMVIILT